MSTLGFDGYVEPLRLYLAKYREVPGRARVHVGALTRGTAAGWQAVKGERPRGAKEETSDGVPPRTHTHTHTHTPARPPV